MAAWTVGFMAPKPPKGSSRSKAASARAEEQAKREQAKMSKIFTADRIGMCGLMVRYEGEAVHRDPKQLQTLTRIGEKSCCFRYYVCSNCRTYRRCWIRRSSGC